MRLKYEPASEPQHISKPGSLNQVRSARAWLSGPANKSSAEKTVNSFQSTAEKSVNSEELLRLQTLEMRGGGAALEALPQPSTLNTGP